MKKIISAAAAIIAPFALNAQDLNSGNMNMEVFNIVATIFVIGLFMVFILNVMKRVVDFRIKRKIIEKGIPENLVSSILQANPKEDRNINVKWFAILAGLGTALTIINYTQPLGIHSLAIMAFCTAASFLGYYFFIRQTDK
jgi:drug/metabolite transporter (DMT)-like permease